MADEERLFKRVPTLPGLALQLREPFEHDRRSGLAGANRIDGRQESGRRQDDAGWQLSTESE